MNKLAEKIENVIAIILSASVILVFVAILIATAWAMVKLILGMGA
jgi:hypothetical protein